MIYEYITININDIKYLSGFALVREHGVPETELESYSQPPGDLMDENGKLQWALIPNPDYGKETITEDETGYMVKSVDERKWLVEKRPQALTAEELAEKERQSQRMEITQAYDYNTELKILREEIVAIRAGERTTARFRKMNMKIERITNE